MTKSNTCIQLSDVIFNQQTCNLRYVWRMLYSKISKHMTLILFYGVYIYMYISGGIVTTECVSDVSYWPLDSQSCDIIVTSWAYNKDQLTFKIGDRNMHLDFYQGMYTIHIL